MIYEIVVDAILPERMADYFQPMSITTNGNYTFIKGNVLDQSSLFGIIATIRDLNLKLVSINRQ